MTEQDPTSATESDPGAQIAARLPITDRPAWLTLLAVGVLLVGGFVWAVMGEAPVVERGEGILVPAHGFIDVGREVTGIVSDIFVAPGQHVAEGEPVAVIRGPAGDETITSPADGVVATLTEREGGQTAPGHPIMTLDPDLDGKVALAFFPAFSGSAVQAGMSVRVAPAAYPQSQYGTITGQVTTIARLPATADRVELLVGGNGALADYFTSLGPVLEATITLDPDPTAPSGYNWTLGRGPDAALETGMLVQATVLIADATPIDRILR